MNNYTFKLVKGKEKIDTFEFYDLILYKAAGFLA